MSTKEKIRELLDEGLSPKEIAEKAGVKTQTVYTYRHMFKKEEEPVAKTETNSKKKAEKDNESLERIRKLEQINKNHLDMLEEKNEKIDELQRRLEDAELEIKALHGDRDELEHKNKRLKQSNSDIKENLKTSQNEFDTAVELSTEEIKELKARNYHITAQLKASDTDRNALEHENSAAQHKIDTLQEDNDKLKELLYRREQRIKEMGQELDAEQEKHNYLSNYARLLMKEGVAHAE